MNVVIVESPAKAKTINKYLGPGYKVLASYGHVRDLPSKDGSVDPDHDFAMKWQVDSRSNKRLNEIAAAVKGADRLYLATDPDREGEAISWHVLEVLAKKKALQGVDVKRVAFNAITKADVMKAMAEPRDINRELVEAYLARRALDYLVGFTLSPILWRKLPGARSAGRVQSVALRLICDREREIELFKPEEYWSITSDMLSKGGDAFEARLHELDGEKLKKMSLQNEGQAMAALEKVKASSFRISALEKKPTKRNPYPPFTTSTLQQEASRKLGFSARHTMRVAQSLYEGKNLNGETVGLITYMRTDGVTMAGEAVHAARAMIKDRYGDRFVPKSPRMYKSKAKNAQEAHEAIRPTDVTRMPAQVSGALNEDEKKLYTLIWNRTIASQMASAEVEQTRVDLSNHDSSVVLRASGSVVTFDGFLKIYQQGKDNDKKQEEDSRLPILKEGEDITLQDATANQHFTEPPPRFSEASLVKKLEELGIGRPSTYASILSVLRDRNYVTMDRGRFIPDDKGRIVTAFLEAFFDRYVEYDFTADLEEQLDKISAGKLDWKKALHDFWDDFSARTGEVADVRTAEVIERLNTYLGDFLFPDDGSGKDPRKCPECDDGTLSLKLGRYGSFIGCSNYPECNYTRRLGADEEAPEESGDRPLGTDPESGLTVFFKTGRFGPYVQLGEGTKEEKPKRASLPKDIDPAGITLEQALALLSLPRDVGVHPETGKPIKAGIGRYGPYVVHEGTFASLSSTAEVFDVGINRAVTLLAEKKAKRSGPSALKTLGDHPDGGEIKVMNGRYGPYVTHNKINATLPKGKDPESVTMEEAIELLAAKEKKGGKKKGRSKAK